jgi:large subunit ribosomal protein L4
MRPKLAVSRFTNLHGSIQNTSIRIRIPVVQFSSASAAEAVVTPRIAPLSLPPNLVIDPRSSFASQYLNKENDDNDDDAVSKDYKQDERREKRLSALRRKPATTGKTRSTIVRFTGAAATESTVDLDDELLYWSQKRDGIVYTKPLPDRLSVEIHTLFTTPTSPSSLCGTIVLNRSVFGCDPIRVDLIKRAVDYYRAKTRGRRTAVTKTISQVSGSGRKVRKQKGGGVARAGHSRPPHWRGGAKAHGPKNVTDYGTVKLNKKVRKLALRHVLSQKLAEGNLVLLNQMHDLPTHKTNELVRLLAPWGLGGTTRAGISALLLDHYPSPDPNDPHATTQASSHAYVPTNLHVAAANVPRLTVSNSLNGASVYSILAHEKLVLTLAALAQLEARLGQDD